MKDLSSQSSATEAENERLKNKVSELQKQVQVKGKANMQKRLNNTSNRFDIALSN